MTNQEMVRVKVYGDGTYAVEDIDPECATQKLVGFDDKGFYNCYNCPKGNYERYLLRLLVTEEIDSKIADLEEAKRRIIRTREEIKKELKK